MIHVLAIVTAKPGLRERILEANRGNVDTVRASAGFAQFGPDAFVMVEQWASMGALRAHAVAPHMKACASRVREPAASRAIHVLQLA
jgi:quinol monooxygenase YgiN